MSTIADVITEVRQDLMTVSGIALFPEAPPEQVHAFPVCLVYPGSGNYRQGSAVGSGGNPMGWGLHTITIDVHKNRTNLPDDILAILPLATDIPHALLLGYQTDKFNGTVVALGDVRTPGGTGGTGAIRYEFLTPSPSGLDAVGYRFELDVTVEEEIV